ncbi:hypothetical protein BDR05DRAFT_950572 [Suillus weaverae]|nr:hypothetical protein BDR05DRAFT_950572 [Suillus weaverae]
MSETLKVAQTRVSFNVQRLLRSRKELLCNRIAESVAHAMKIEASWFNVTRNLTNLPSKQLVIFTCRIWRFVKNYHYIFDPMSQPTFVVAIAQSSRPVPLRTLDKPLPRDSISVELRMRLPFRTEKVDV